jgi:protein TonB
MTRTPPATPRTPPAKARRGATAAHKASRPGGQGNSAVLMLAIGISVLLHGVVLAVQFQFPDFAKSFKKDTGLEVVLVNARHARAPKEAEALAQANLDGGGNTDAPQMASTPLPPKDQRREGDQLIDAQRRVEKLESAQRKLLAEARTKHTAVQVNKNSDTPAEKPREISGVDLADSAAAIARLEAKLDKQLNEYAKRPRKKFIGARTQEYRFAQYVEDWRQKIERVGTLNYPDSARGRLYGSLLMSVVLRADGSVARVNIHRSSGHKVLDEAAERIVRLASPFAPFPPNIRRDTDELEITRTWTFTNADAVRTE